MFLLDCTSVDDLSLVLLFKNIMNIVCILVPVVLIILIVVKLVSVTLKDEEFTSKVWKYIMIRVLAGFVIFMLPSFVNLINGIFYDEATLNGLCFNEATPMKVAAAESLQKAKDAQEIAEYEKNKKEQAKLQKQKEEMQKKKDEENKKNIISGNRRGSSWNGENLIYYNQTELPWATMTYHPSCGAIAGCGCGPTSAAIVGATLLQDKSITPKTAVDWMCSRGYCHSYGSDCQGNADYLASLGINASQAYPWNSQNEQILLDKMQEGGYMAIVVANNTTGRNIFTASGHFFVVTGVINGEFTVANPSRRWQLDQTFGLDKFRGDAVNFYLFNVE